MGALKVFVVAGEASGDKLGSALMAGLKTLAKDISFQGVGGPLMQARGLQSQFPMEELSVMGLAEILPKYFHFKRRIKETAEAVIKAKPDVLITIDSPDFCLRVAKQVKAASVVRCVHYVAPTVWAWRAGRAAKMARHIDHVLALFPFEPPYMTAAGMACDFVGHPVVAEPVPAPKDEATLRAKHGLGDAPLLLVLPGSRKGEVARLAETFCAAIAPILKANPKMRVVIPSVASRAQQIREVTQSWDTGTHPPLILTPDAKDPEASLIEKKAAFSAATLALAASGTVSLELAAANTPMVIAYDMSRLSRIIISRMLKVDTVTLVNLVAESRTVQEFIGADCRPEKITPALTDLLADPSAQNEAMALTMARLGQGGEAPGLRAARAVLGGLGRA